MGAIFSYSIESGIILIFLYIAYCLTMAGEKQFAVNRVVVYVIYAVSLLAPAAYPALKAVQFGNSQNVGGNIEIFPDFGATMILPEESNTLVWPGVLLWIYIIGVALASVRLLLSIMRIVYIAKSKENIRLDNGYILVLTGDRRFSPFSFLRYIVISREDYEKSKDEIMTHEFTHLRNLHWIDQMLGNLVAIFMWYNPSAWLMIEELKSIHEYQADSAVIDSGADVRRYQYLLIEKAVGKRFPSPANSLNHSKLKKRVTMMYKSKPSKMRRMAAFAVIPAAIVAIAVIDIPAVAEVITETGSAKLLAVSDGKVNNFYTDEQIKSNGESTEKPIQVIAVGAVKKGEDPNSAKMIPVHHLDEMQVVAPANPDAALPEKKSSSSDRYDVTYYVNGVQTPAAIAEKTDPDKIESMEVERPDISNPNKGTVRITLKSPDAVSAKSDPKSQVYVSVDNQPEFPGGMNGLMKYLSNTVRYPEQAMLKNIQGKVIVKFIVTKNGDVVEPAIVRGVDPLLDQESMRVVNSMPKWIPGKNGDEPVDCYFTLPINFRLQENKKAQKTDSSGQE